MITDTTPAGLCPRITQGTPAFPNWRRRCPRWPSNGMKRWHRNVRGRLWQPVLERRIRRKGTDLIRKTVVCKWRLFRRTSIWLPADSNHVSLAIIRGARKTGTVRGSAATALSSRQRSPIFRYVHDCWLRPVTAPGPAGSQRGLARSANCKIISIVRRRIIDKSSREIRRTERSSVIF